MLSVKTIYLEFLPKLLFSRQLLSLEAIPCLLLVEKAAKDAELGLLVRHALATGGSLALAAIAGETLVGGHPTGALHSSCQHAQHGSAPFTDNLLCGEAAQQWRACPGAAMGSSWWARLYKSFKCRECVGDGWQAIKICLMDG